MEAAHVPLHLLMGIVQGIETCGALLDPLPFKTKGQGRKRFRLALRKLFPSNYNSANQQLDLYGQLRSHLSHCMLPANTVQIHEDGSDIHLQFTDKVLQVSLRLLFLDYCCAVEKLMGEFDAGNLKTKKIVFDNLNDWKNGSAG